MGINNDNFFRVKWEYKSKDLGYSVGTIEETAQFNDFLKGLHVLYFEAPNGGILGKAFDSTDDKVFGVFGLTNDEYKLKEKDKQKLDSIALSIINNCPYERLLRTNSVLCEMSNCISIDDGAYSNEIEKIKTKVARSRLMKAILNDHLWRCVNVDNPYVIGLNGGVSLYTLERYPENYVRGTIRKITDIRSFFVDLFRYGICNLYVDFELKIKRDDFCEYYHFPKEYGFVNSQLCSVIIDSILYDINVRNNDRIVTPNRDEDYYCDDRIKCFLSGMYYVGILPNNDKYRLNYHQDRTITSDYALCKIRNTNPTPILFGINDKDGVGFVPFSSIDNEQNIRYFAMSGQEGNSCLLIFTDIHEICLFKEMNKNVDIVPYLITFEELRNLLPFYSGLIINRQTFNYYIDSDGIKIMLEKSSDASAEVENIQPNSQQASKTVTVPYENMGEKNVNYEIEWLTASNKSIISVVGDCTSKYSSSCILLLNREFKDEPQEFDHIIVCPAGIVLIETKHWNGSVVFDEEGRMTHTGNDGNTKKSKNPKPQIRHHEALIKSIFTDINVYSLLCFSNKNLKITGSEYFDICPIIYVENLADTVLNLCKETLESECLTDEEISEIVEKINLYKHNINSEREE